MKTSAKTSVAPQQKPQPQPKESSGPVAKVGAVALGCTLATGCAGPSTSTTPQVQPMPLPPTAPCPEDSARSMRQLGIAYVGSSGFCTVLEDPEPGPYTTVRPGPVTMRLTATDYWGKLPRGTLFTGELLFGERVQGRFTEAHTPDGHTYVVCLELRHGPEWGLEKKPGSTRDTARVFDSGNLEPVERFGEAWRYEDRERK